jgi:SWI/SNF-related matrix-associated actin-dependent regulator of chromatin subfamily D
MTDVAGNPEEERRADYFYQPWCQEAVCRYFYGKVKKNHSVVSFGFVGMSE